MGMGTQQKKNKKNKSKKKSGSNNSKGMGKSIKSNNNIKIKKSSSTPFDASASLQRSEKMYEELQQASARALHRDNNDDDKNLASEMIVTVKSSNAKIAGTSDWVPVAQLLLQPHTEVGSEAAQAAISLYCRELSFCATLGAKIFSAVPRNELQYAIEPIDSFHKFVYDPLMEQQQHSDKENEQEEVMTKAQAREILQLNEKDAADRSQIKQSYRRQSFQWHPDRVGDGDNDDEQMKEHAAQQYARIQKAYAVLSSDVRSAGTSWYASLGGRERTDFRTIPLLGRDAATAILERNKVKSAVAGLDRDLVQVFVTRNQASKSS